MNIPTASLGREVLQHELPPCSTASSETAHGIDVEQGEVAAAVVGEKVLQDEKQNSYVTWDGPHDPDHPQNWPLLTKLRISILLTCITLSVSMGSSIFGPGAQEVEQNYNIGPEVAVLGTSLYLLV